MARFVKKCGRCNSADISVDAFAMWDFENQTWILRDIHDNYYCHRCCDTYDFTTLKEEDIDAE